MRKKILVKTACTFALMINALATYAVAAGSPDIELRERRVAECGVESYASREDPLCGVASHRVARSAACGIDRFNSRASKICPGYRAASTYPISKTTTCGGSNPREELTCEKGHRRSNYSALTSDCWRNAFNKSRRWNASATCNVPEIIRTCRDVAFGVERYRSCRNPGHGVESYHSCSRPEFGVEQYNLCAIRATRDELNQKLAGIRSNVPTFAVKLLQAQAEYYAADKSDKAMACLIDRYEDDPSFEAIAADLKTFFAKSFGKKYVANEYDCKNAALTMEQCDDKDDSIRCRAYRSYAATKGWFITQVNDLEILKYDVVASQDVLVHRSIDEIRSSLQLEIDRAPKIAINKLISLAEIVSIVESDIGDKRTFRYVLTATAHDGSTSEFEGIVDGDTVSFPVGEEIQERYKSCSLKVWGEVDPRLDWKEVEGLYYASEETDILNELPTMNLIRKFIRFRLVSSANQ